MNYEITQNDDGTWTGFIPEKGIGVTAERKAVVRDTLWKHRPKDLDTPDDTVTVEFEAEWSGSDEEER